MRPAAALAGAGNGEASTSLTPERSPNRMNTRHMTRKQALAALYRLRGAYLALVCGQDHATFEASRAVREESFDALLVLVDAIHGQRKPGEDLFLCEVCHLRR